MSTINTVSVEFTGKDQNWQDGETIYWFELTGEQHGTNSEFDGDVFGVVEADGNQSYIDADGCPLPSDGDTPAIRRALADSVTDELRTV